MTKFIDIPEHLRSISVDSAYRLMNIGATAVISAANKGDEDAMTAAWNCALDLNPTKVTVVLSREHYTRKLLEASGFFAISLVSRANVESAQYLGSVSKNDDKEKLDKCPGRFFRAPGCDIPLIEGSPAYFICKVIPEERIAKTYDLFLAEVVACYADDRVATEGGDWRFESADPSLRTVHAASHGRFYAIGDLIDLNR